MNDSCQSTFSYFTHRSSRVVNKQYEAASRVRGFYSSLMEIYAMVSLWQVNLLCVLRCIISLATWKKNRGEEYFQKKKWNTWPTTFRPTLSGRKLPHWLHAESIWSAIQMKRGGLITIYKRRLWECTQSNMPPLFIWIELHKLWFWLCMLAHSIISTILLSNCTSNVIFHDPYCSYWQVYCAQLYRGLLHLHPFLLFKIAG